MANTNNERLARLETEMAQVVKSQEEFKESWKTVDDKLDTLLALRNQGIGAFWLATSLAGIGGISIIAQIIQWFKG